MRLLRGQLRLEVIDRAAEQRRHRVDDALAARRQAVDTVAGPVPQRDAGRGAIGVEPVEDMVAHLRILLHGAAQQRRLFAIEQAAHDHESVLLESGQLRRTQDRCHGFLLPGCE